MRVRRMKWVTLLMIAVIMAGIIPVTSAYAEEEVLTETKLVAGQNKEVGTVKVRKSGINQLSVTYSLYDQAKNDGWLIYEISFAIGDALSDIPHTKSNNMKPGQFRYKKQFPEGIAEYSEIVDISGYGVGTNLYFAAHAIVKQTIKTVFASAPYSGYVVAYDQGVTYPGYAFPPSRRNPETGLYYEEGNSRYYYFSLGFKVTENDSYIIIGFDKPIMNGPGNDIQVIEYTYGQNNPNEVAEVFVSNDGVNWVSLGLANNHNPISAYNTATEFDLETVGFESAKYVKLQDRCIRSDFAYLYPEQCTTLDGFDLNAVLALHDNAEITVYEETAWGAGARYSGKGSWGTYFTCVLR